MPKSKSSFFIIGILVSMLAASLITVLILYVTGGLAPTPVELEFTVKPVAAKEYDGKPLMPFGYTWDAGQLKKGHRMEITPIGEQTECGTSESDLLINIYDEEGHNANSQYAIKVNKSPLTVTSRKLTIFLKAQDIPYSGEEAEIKEYDIYKGVNLSGKFSDFEAGELMTGDKLVVCFPGFKNVGDVLPDVTQWKSENFKIYDSFGNVVTHHYELNEAFYGSGEVRIVPRRIKVNALDVEKSYDGKAVTGKFELASGALAPGHFIGEAKFKNSEDRDVSVVNAGDSASVKVSSVTIYEQNEYDVVPLSAEMQKNYEVDLHDPVYGVWSVVPRKIIPTLNDRAVNYSGELVRIAITQLIESVNVVVSNELASSVEELNRIKGDDGDYFEIVCDREICDAGTYTYSVRLTEAGENLFGRGNLVCDGVTAKIIVDKLPAKIVYKGTKEKGYDGSELELDAKKLELQNSEGAALSNFCVSSAEFRYSGTGDHTVTGSHNVLLHNVHIARTEESHKDIAENFMLTVPEIQVNISRGTLKAMYKGPLKKTYDGKEIELSADDFEVYVEEGSAERRAPALFVNDFTVKYDDGGLVEHHTVAGTYTLKIESIKVALKERPAKDIAPYVQSVSIQDFDFIIERADLSVIAAKTQVVIFPYPSISNANDACNNLAMTLGNELQWQGLKAGDVVTVPSGAITFSSSNNTIYTFTLDWSLVEIRNAAGESAKDSYSFSGGDSPIVGTLISLDA